MKLHFLQKDILHNSTRQKKSINQRGFTLVELIMVMAILGVLASMAIIVLREFRDKAKIARTASEIRALEKEIFSYATDNQNYPPDNDLSVIGRAGMLDPWGNPYVYRTTLVRTYTGVKINTDFDLYSYGPSLTSSNGTTVGPGNDDDIVRGSDGSFVGIALDFGI